MALDRDDAQQRKERIDVILEELRLNTEDLTELAKQARDRAHRSIDESRLAIGRARALRDGKKR